MERGKTVPATPVISGAGLRKSFGETVALDGARLRETVAPPARLGGWAGAPGVFRALPLTASAGPTPDPRSSTRPGALLLFAATGGALAELAGGLGLRLATRQATAHRE